MFETAYPKLNPNPKKRDLEELFSPNHDEIMLAKRTCKSEGSLLGFLVTLKTFQRLGYFVYVRDVPPAITEHVVRALGFLFIPATLSTYDASGKRDVHLKAIRAHQQVAPFQSGGQAILERAAFEAAQSKEDLRDLINACIEQIVRQRFTLPGLSTIRKTVQRIRAEVNDQLFQVVFNALTLEDRTKLEGVLARRIAVQNTVVPYTAVPVGESVAESVAGTEGREGSTGWARVKQDPGKPSLQHFKLLLGHRAWLLERQPNLRVSTLLPNAKFQQFAAEADSLDAARMRDLEPFKRATLTAVLLEVKAAKVLNDLGEVFVKRMMHIHRLAKEALARHQLERQARTDALVQTLKDVLIAYNTPGSVGQRLGEIDKVVRDRTEQLINECEQHAALSGQNYFPFLWRYYSNHRATLFKLLGLLDLRSTTQDSSLLHAIAFIVAAEGKRAEWLGLEPSSEKAPAQTPAQTPAPLNLEWLSDRWWTLVTGQTRREAPIMQINRKQFEVCVFTRLLWDLKSGDLSIHGSLEFADYRTQLVNDSEFDAMLAEFCEQVGLPADPQTLIAQARSTLEGHARTADAAFPNNIGVRLEAGKLVLKAVQATPVPKRFVWLERQLESRLGLHPILDVLADTENLLGWSRFFGPISGLEAKLERAQDKYLITTFSYGCNLGPTETARAVEGVNRQQLQWVNTRHVTERPKPEGAAVGSRGRTSRTPRTW